MLSGINQAAVDEVESQIFTYDVKLTNKTDENFLTWKEVIDQNSTRCKIFLYLFPQVQQCAEQSGIASSGQGG